MKKEIVRKDPETTKMEYNDLPEIVVHEEKYYLDSEMVVQYELNMLELPFFSKNGKVEKNRSIKYIFSESTNSYMQAVPSGHEKTGQKIPQEFDEKIFLALMRLAKVQGKTIVTTYYQLLKFAQIKQNGESYKRVKESLYRMDGTNYYLQNCFYSPLLKTVVPGEKTIKIIQKVEIIDLNRIEVLPDKMKEQYMKYFNRNKVEEIIQVVLSDEVYTNIEDKGYLLYDVEELLTIETSGERKLYQMLMKWSHKGKIKIVDKKCKYLAAKIPLSVTPENISNTIRILKKYSENLVKTGYIKSYKFLRESPVLESNIVYEFNDFTGKHRLLATENYKLQENQEMPETIIIDAEILKEEPEDSIQTTLFDTEEKKENSSVTDILPEQHRTETNLKILKKFKGRGINYLVSNIEYTKRNCKENFDVYLKKCLINDWAKGEREKEELQKKKEKEEKNREAEGTIQSKKNAEDIYNRMSPEELQKLHEEVERSSYYKFMVKEKVDRNEIKKEDAFKEVSLVLISGRIQKN